ncbi:hypothetical protein TH63_04795 [Rufibacter radiotolerans]|uniref:STAS/SEC14 domain-containing protein n=1 Tax=Rufibacter radiotolerans TaxID=1379910 RepID=A0A0H4VML3_9BACT|nr:hypothetical protein [Rufibacter radiotolerans]AKQ45107.1 hypothetical protein TH63_04795 [Rufibacter radiotolerans]
MRIDLNPVLVYSDEYIKVEIDEHVGYLYLEWLQKPNKEAFRRLFHYTVNLALEKGCSYWLSDARQIPYLDFGDQNWILREMAPLFLSSSIKKYARLTTKQGVGMLDIHRISSNLPGDAEAQLENFTNKDAALDWLFSDFFVNSSSVE